MAERAFRPQPGRRRAPSLAGSLESLRYAFFSRIAVGAR